MAGTFSQYPFSTGQNAQGYHVENLPSIFTGQVQFQKGRWSFPPTITQPGTATTGVLVANSTGYDCLVYAQATTGINGGTITSYNGPNATATSLAGSLGANTQGTYYVPGPGAIQLNYVGTLTWKWYPL